MALHTNLCFSVYTRKGVHDKKPASFTAFLIFAALERLSSTDETNFLTHYHHREDREGSEEMGRIRILSTALIFLGLVSFPEIPALRHFAFHFFHFS